MTSFHTRGSGDVVTEGVNSHPRGTFFSFDERPNITIQDGDWQTKFSSYRNSKFNVIKANCFRGSKCQRERIREFVVKCRNEGKPTLILTSKVFFSMKKGCFSVKMAKFILYRFVELLNAKAEAIGRG